MCALDMPKGPQGQKRPADVIGCAVHVARIATGEIEDTAYRQPNKAKGGKAGGRARSASLDPDRKRETAKIAAAARWSEGR